MKHDDDPLDFDSPKHERRRISAEAWGTFLLVAVTAGVRIAQHAGYILPEMASLAAGLVVMVIIYSSGAVSGAHLNPAVTLAFALRRNFPWQRVPMYLVAQLAGGILAALFLCALFGREGDLGATVPGHGWEWGRALALEIFLTAGLVHTILGTAAEPRNVGNNGAIAVGAYIAVVAIWAESYSGASMNPVRSLAPDLVRWQWQTTWIYIAGPLMGALLGVALEKIIKGPHTAKASKAAQGNPK